MRKRSCFVCMCVCVLFSGKMYIFLGKCTLSWLMSQVFNGLLYFSFSLESLISSIFLLHTNFFWKLIPNYISQNFMRKGIFNGTQIGLRMDFISYFLPTTLTGLTPPYNSNRVGSIFIVRKQTNKQKSKTKLKYTFHCFINDCNLIFVKDAGAFVQDFRLSSVAIVSHSIFKADTCQSIGVLTRLTEASCSPTSQNAF